MQQNDDWMRSVRIRPTHHPMQQDAKMKYSVQDLPAFNPNAPKKKKKDPPPSAPAFSMKDESPPPPLYNTETGDFQPVPLTLSSSTFTQQPYEAGDPASTLTSYPTHRPFPEADPALTLSKAQSLRDGRPIPPYLAYAQSALAESALAPPPKLSAPQSSPRDPTIPAEPAENVFSLVHLNDWWGDMYRWIDYIVCVRDNINYNSRTTMGYDRLMWEIERGYSMKQVSKWLDTVLIYCSEVKEQLQELIQKFYMNLLIGDPKWKQAAKSGFNLQAKEILADMTYPLIWQGLEKIAYCIGTNETAHLADVDETGMLKKTFLHVPPPTTS